MNTQQLEQQADIHMSIALNLQSIILYGQMAEKYKDSEDIQSEYQQRLDRHSKLMAQIEMPEKTTTDIYTVNDHPNQD